MWHLFWISAPPELRDAVSGFLPGMGSVGVVEEAGNLGAYFPASDSSREGVESLLNVMIERLGRSGLDVSGVRFSYEPVADRDWNEVWKQEIRPVRLKCRVTVVPPWHAGDGSDAGVSLIIDPGSAFGTGHHETTADCICAIRSYASEAKSVSTVFADLGTGTGLLAILATRLGFSPVHAIDHDPEAVAAAVHNISLNDLRDAVHVEQGSVEALPQGCGMIAANLFAGLLADFMERIADGLFTGGLIVASGMLEGQDEAVISRMKDCGLQIRERVGRERWVTLVGVKV